MDQSNYTLPGIMHYLQNQYTIIEKNKILNELEKSELKLKITKLESEKNSLLIENDKLREKVKALEKQQNDERSSHNGKSKSHNNHNNIHNKKNGEQSNRSLKQENEDEGGGDDDDSSLEKLETIDTTNLIKAKQFLKNTTNEILFLLNSPSVDTTDPLGLTRDDVDFPMSHIQDENTNQLTQHSNNNNNNNNHNNNNNNTNESHNFMNEEEILSSKFSQQQQQQQQSNISNTGNGSNITVTDAEKQQQWLIDFEQDQQQRFDDNEEMETDAETVVDNDLDADEADADNGNENKDGPVSSMLAQTLINTIDLPTSENTSPIDFLEVDQSTKFAYYHNKNASSITTVDLKRKQFSTIELNKKFNNTSSPKASPKKSQQQQQQQHQKNNLNRIFKLCSAPSGNSPVVILEACSNALYQCSRKKHQAPEKLKSFRDDIIAFDTISMDADANVILVAILTKEDQSPFLFELQTKNKSAMIPYRHDTFTQLPTEFDPAALRFNTDTELTMVAKDGKIIRYDYSRDELVSVNDLNVNLSNGSKYALSSTYFIHEANSSRLTLYNLSTEEAACFIINHSYQIKSISLMEKYFTLNYNTGEVELYDLTQFFNSSMLFNNNNNGNDNQQNNIYHMNHSNNNNNTMNGRNNLLTMELPSPVMALDYYEKKLEGGKPHLIKDIAVNLTRVMAPATETESDSESETLGLSLFIIGTDAKCKEFRL